MNAPSCCSAPSLESLADEALREDAAPTLDTPPEPNANDDVARARRTRWFQRALAGAFAMNTMVIGLAVSLAPPQGATRALTHAALAGSVVVVFGLAGRPLLTALADAFRARRVGLETLFTAGILAALALSVHATVTGQGHAWYEVAATLIVLHALGADLRTAQRRRAIETLLDAIPMPPVVPRQTCCGGFRDVPLEQIRPGDRIRVFPGQALPVDGRVVEGHAFVDESLLRGEPHPRSVRPGDRVEAGSSSVDGALLVEVRHALGERRLDRVRALVADAVRDRVPMQTAIERSLNVLVVVVFSTAVVAALAGVPSAGIDGIDMRRALAVLVVACPCALGFALPLVAFSLVRRLALRGVVIRRPEVLERLAEVDTVVFDKTGTLTRRALRIVDVHPLAPDALARHDVLASAAAVERLVSHPIASAFRDVPVGAWRATEPRILAGRGVAAAARRGSDERAVDVEVVADDEEGDHRVLRVRHEGRDVGRIVLVEEQVPHAQHLMRSLRALGMHTVILTGDRLSRALPFGADEVVARCSPSDKWERVAALLRDGRRVLLVGDGVNDAPAAATADVFLAVGDDGVAATQLADGTWDGRDSDDLVWTMHAVRDARTTWRRLFAWVVGYNTVGISIAAAGWLHPVIAAVLMTASSLGSVLWAVLHEERRARARARVTERASLTPRFDTPSARFPATGSLPPA